MNAVHGRHVAGGAPLANSPVRAAALMVPSSGRAAENGREAYQLACAICYAKTPPSPRDKRGWDTRLQKRRDVIINAVIKGTGTMPARGGQPALTGAQISAAVDCMLTTVR